MITVFARLRAENWVRFREAHDQEAVLQLRRELGNRSHRVLAQLDDPADIVFLDTWDLPQSSDSYYHSDDFQRHLAEMGADLIEIIKLEHASVAELTEGPPLDVDSTGGPPAPPTP